MRILSSLSSREFIFFRCPSIFEVSSLTSDSSVSHSSAGQPASLFPFVIYADSSHSNHPFSGSVSQIVRKIISDESNFSFNPAKHPSKYPPFSSIAIKDPPTHSFTHLSILSTHPLTHPIHPPTHLPT